ncbi:redoxin family protein [Candidatus Woesearchaeota archaeon]|nr:redoxin family protein [Candidatus Woesearchaeota archaeon]
MKKSFYFLFIAFSVFLVGCSHTEIPTDSSLPDREPTSGKLSETILNAQLKDINSQKIFTINDFNGKPILLESFAVWCPVCTKQQGKIKELHEEIGDSVVSISLDTDSNEDEEKVREHLQRNKFDWYYAISPAELTKELIEEFGTSVINAPQAPVILICQDQSAKMLGRGVKSVSELKEAINSCS